MRFQPADAADHLAACAPQPIGVGKIGFFVKPRLRFDDDLHLLARFGRLGKGAHHLAVVADAVQRGLDTDDVRVYRGLAVEVDNRLEAVIGMEQQASPVLADALEICADPSARG